MKSTASLQTFNSFRKQTTRTKITRGSSVCRILWSEPLTNVGSWPPTERYWDGASLKASWHVCKNVKGKEERLIAYVMGIASDKLH